MSRKSGLTQLCLSWRPLAGRVCKPAEPGGADTAHTTTRPVAAGVESRLAAQGRCCGDTKGRGLSLGLIVAKTSTGSEDRARAELCLRAQVPGAHAREAWPGAVLTIRLQGWQRRGARPWSSGWTHSLTGLILGGGVAPQTTHPLPSQRATRPLTVVSWLWERLHGKARPQRHQQLEWCPAPGRP